MKMISISILLACTVIVASRHYYILTKFNDLQRYAFKMAESDFNLNNINQNQEPNISYNFCLFLLAAPIFEMISEVGNTSLERIDKGFHEIDPSALDQLDMNRKTRSINSVQLCYIGGPLFWLPTIGCLNHESQFAWIASYATDLGTGILFQQADPNSDNIYALIENTKRLPYSKKFMMDKFLASVSKTDPIQGEFLCHLKKISQFRLCSILTDSVYRRPHNLKSLHYQRSQKKKRNKQETNQSHEVIEYADPYSNYFIDNHYGTPENCPLITINNPGISKFQVTALYCHTMMKNKLHKFYVKRNLNERDQVYIIIDGVVQGGVVVKQLLSIIKLDANL